jgi:hypothetical protein
MSKEFIRVALPLAIAVAALVAAVAALDATHIVNLSRLTKQTVIQYV